jgi:sensor histidine kinase YesM
MKCTPLPHVSHHNGRKKKKKHAKTVLLEDARNGLLAAQKVQNLTQSALRAILAAELAKNGQSTLFHPILKSSSSSTTTSVSASSIGSSIIRYVWLLAKYVLYLVILLFAVLFGYFCFISMRKSSTSFSSSVLHRNENMRNKNQLLLFVDWCKAQFYNNTSSAGSKAKSH